MCQLAVTASLQGGILENDRESHAAALSAAFDFVKVSSLFALVTPFGFLPGSVLYKMRISISFSRRQSRAQAQLPGVRELPCSPQGVLCTWLEDMTVLILPLEGRAEWPEHLLLMCCDVVSLPRLSLSQSCGPGLPRCPPLEGTDAA